MAVGIVGIYATNTVLHGDARYGLAFVLVAAASIALRMGKERPSWTTHGRRRGASSGASAGS
jgi:hypothetical protein